MFDLSGKITVVTGAGSGIGEAIAHALAEAKAKVYVAERNAAEGERVAAELRRSGFQAQSIVTDVAKE